MGLLNQYIAQKHAEKMQNAQIEAGAYGKVLDSYLNGEVDEPTGIYAFKKLANHLPKDAQESFQHFGTQVFPSLQPPPPPVPNQPNSLASQPVSLPPMPMDRSPVPAAPSMPPPPGHGPDQSANPISSAVAPAAAPTMAAPPSPAPTTGPPANFPHRMTPLESFQQRQLPLQRAIAAVGPEMAQAQVARYNAFAGDGAFQKLPPEQQTDWILGKEMRFAPVHTAGEGQLLFDAKGNLIGSGPDKPVTTAAGSETHILPATINGTPVRAPGAPNIPPPPGTETRARLIASPPPQLSPEESRRLDAAKLVASKYKFQFDPNINPKNPGAQIPQQYLAEFNATDKTLNEDPELKQMRLDSAQSLAGLRASMEENRSFQRNLQLERRTESSRTKQSAELAKIGRPVADSIKNFGTLNDLLTANSPMADSQIAIALVKAENAGAGSGVRITQSEINNTQGGKTQWEKLKSEIGKWNPDSSKPFAFTDAQRTQVRQMARKAMDKLSTKQRILDDANDSLLQSDEPKDHLRVVNDAKKRMVGVDMEGQSNIPPPPGATVTVKTKAERDALKPGSQYLRPGDATVYVKQ